LEIGETKGTAAKGSGAKDKFTVSYYTIIGDEKSSTSWNSNRMLIFVNNGTEWRFDLPKKLIDEHLDVGYTWPDFR